MNFTKDIYNHIISFILNLHPLLLVNKRTYKLTKIYLDKVILIPYNYNRYKYYINKYKLNYNICLRSNNIEIVKLGFKNGANDFNYCLISDNIEIVKLGIENGADDFNWCLFSNNMEVVNLGIENGAKNFDWCLMSNNIEVVKLGIENGAKDFDTCLRSNNIKVVKLGIKKGAKLGIEKDAKNFNLYNSNNLETLIYLHENKYLFNDIL